MEPCQRNLDEQQTELADRMDCGMLIKRINDTLEKQANSELQKCDITYFQFKMLAALHFLGSGTATLKELERHFGVAQSTAAGIVTRLERKQLIESFHSASDRRVKCVRITPAGCALCEEHREAVERSEANMLQCLTEEERQQLREMLLRVYRSLV
ncbi:MAG: MarR family transcriptional regulator [Clostridiales bacterium]|nr:MarR family transcriptional regulator [Clostridiales bacterium]